MSDNVGLSTPRGSGTSGFVQRSRAYMRPRDQNGPYANPRDFLDSNNNNARKSRLRQPDQGILDHDRKRTIEVQVFALRDELEEKEVAEDEIERQCDALREKLTANQQKGGSASSSAAPHRFKAHQVHEQARAKIEETERLRRALHISKDYEEGGHWRRQEEKQALKRKKEEEEEEKEKEFRQREEEQQSRHATNSPPPLRSVEKGGDPDHDDNRSGRSDHSDRSRGREDGRRVRQRRGSSPGDDSRSRSLSRSRSQSYSSRSRSRSGSESR